MDWRLRGAAVCVVFLSLNLAGCDDKTATSSKAPTSVRVEKIEFKPYVPIASLTGEIAARITSDLSFRVTGRVSARLVDVGTHVTKGQLLARIEPTQQEADVRSAAAGLAAADASLKQATATFDRQKALLGDGFTTRRDFDQAERALSVAQANLATAKAQLALAENALSYTELYADDAGIITARNVDVGEVAQAAQVVFTLAKDGPRDAIFEVNESLLLGAPPSINVDVSLVRNPDVKVTGTVRQVSPTVNGRTGTVRVKVGLDQPPSEMTLGAVVSGAGRLGPVRTVTLPWLALSSQDGKPAVFVLDPTTQKVNLRKVTVLVHRSGSVVISGGLQPDETVVVEGARLLQPGQIVAPVKDVAS